MPYCKLINDIFIFLTQVVNKDQSVSYVWQFKSNIANPPPLDCTFSIVYQKTSEQELKPRKCACDFRLQDYQVKYHFLWEQNMWISNCTRIN